MFVRAADIRLARLGRSRSSPSWTTRSPWRDIAGQWTWRALWRAARQSALCIKLLTEENRRMFVTRERVPKLCNRR